MGRLFSAGHWYFWAIYASGLALIVDQVAPLAMAGRLTPSAVVPLRYLALFLLLTYLAERTYLHLRGALALTLSTTTHVAVILLFPPPYPLLVAFLAVLATQGIDRRKPLYKRAFNVCHTTLTVGLTSAVGALVISPTALLHADRILSVLPALALIVTLYYVVDTGTLLPYLAIHEAQSPWRIWRQSYLPILLPDLATGAIGILAAVVWLYHPVLLALFAAPVAALRAAFRAIARAEQQAQALQRRSEQLEAVLAAGHQLRVQHTPVDLLQPVAEAARAVTGAASVAAYLRDRADSALLERVVLAPVDADAAGPARMPVPASGQMRATEGTERTLLMPLELMDAGIIGLLRLVDVPAELSHDTRDTLAILATQTSIALENARLLARAQEARAKAEAAVRVRDEFLSVAAHELKTPMTSVQGFAQVLLGWLEQDEDIDPALQRRALRTIVAQSGKLNQLVCQLLDLSRLERDQLVLERQETDLVPLVREVMATVQAQTVKHTLALEAPPALPAVVDPLRLEQVLTNLLSNALKFSPEGGSVELTLTTPAPDQVGLTVRDHGLGIPEAQRAGLFARFHQAHAHSYRSGLGLGLYISRQIVEMHGGRIAADFPPDGGTRFVVCLPRGRPTGRVGSEEVSEEVRA